jgi:hypothetical protein
VGEIRLPASLKSLTASYVSTRRYYYYHRKDTYSLLCPTAVKNNEAVYTELKALHLDAMERSLKPLRMFVSLVYLGVRLDGSKADVSEELVAALGCMPHLRVLLIEGSSQRVEGPLCALPKKCLQLQHLTVRMADGAIMASLASMEHLISLCVKTPARVTDWGWLEAVSEKGRLEHLHIEGAGLPTEIGCRIISQNQVRTTLPQILSDSNSPQ